MKPALAALSGAVGIRAAGRLREPGEPAPCPRLGPQPRSCGPGLDRRVACARSPVSSRPKGSLLGLFGAAGGRADRDLVRRRAAPAGAGNAAAARSHRRGRDRGAVRGRRGARLCAIAASLVPAWQATRTNAVVGPETGSGFLAAAQRRFAALLAAGQLALSLVLLIGAGLMGRAFVSLRSVPLGFDADRALTMTIALHGQRFNRGTLDEARATRLDVLSAAEPTRSGRSLASSRWALACRCR